MTQEQLDFATEIIEHGGTYPGFKNGSRYKGVRFKQFEIFFKSAFGGDADASAAINELIRSEKVLAVSLECSSDLGHEIGKRFLFRHLRATFDCQFRKRKAEPTAGL